MVFIIEGVDGSGKSTVVEHLKREFPGIAFIKESYPGESEDIRYDKLDDLRDCILSSRTYLYDRATAVDDFIYEPVIAKKSSCLDWKVVRPILMQCKIIYLKCDIEVLKNRLSDRGDDYITANEPTLSALATRYEAFMNKVDNITIDVTNITEEEEWKSVADVILSSINLYPKKKQKIAHILPKKLLNLTVPNQYHMSLAHLYHDEEYVNFYRRMVAVGNYVLMDNGAAEGEQLRNDQLLECYNKVHPTELVLPDTLCNKDETILKAKKAIPFFLQNGVKCKFMAVPQGQNLDEWIACAEVLASLPEVHCLGVSKFLTIQTKDPDVRYKAVTAIDEIRKALHRDDLEVHLLGCDVGPSEVAAIFEDFDFVRGCDTALAYIYAAAGEEMTEDSKRPSGEINFLNGGIDSEDDLVAAMNNFNNIAGIVNLSDYTWN